MAHDVVIAGGGFGCLYAARRLERRLPRHGARIVLVSDVNFLLYSPLLPGAAAGSLEPRHVVVPLREELEWTDVRLARVTGADPTLNELHVDTVDGREESIRYDQLVVALGSVSRVLPVPGLAEHAVGFKTLADGIALRNRAIWCLEVAESLTDEEARREYLTFVFVGAGYAGVEGIAELQDFVADTLDRYPRCRLTGTRWILFRYRTLGVFVDMGQHKAVATILGVRLRGFPAWFAARTYHLAMMPGLGRRVRLGLDWAVGLPFGRAAAELGQLGHPDPLERHLEESSAP